jgi:phosphoglucomutase
VIKFNEIGTYRFTNVERIDKPVFTVKIVENVAHYIALMKEQFDFDVIRKLFAREDFKFLFDGLYGAAGPYAKALFEHEFKGNIVLDACENKEDFNHHHPDPNLKCAEQLVKKLGVFSEAAS